MKIITRNGFTGSALKAMGVMALLTMAGCNDSDGSDDSKAESSTTKPALVSTSISSILTRSQIDAVAAQSGLTQLAGLAKCDVKIYTLTYNTVGVNNEQVTEAGALMVPTGSDCEQEVPLMANAHGTRTSKQYSNTLMGNSFVDIAVYAAQGYAVVAPNYLGLGGSDYGFHPYLHAETEAFSMINSIKAAQEAAGTLSVNLSGKVMLKGYSQGGHSAMAAQRKIEKEYADEITLVASSPMAGPYLLEETLLQGIEPDIKNISAGVLLAYIVKSYQQTYGNVYSDLTEVFKAEYVDTVEQYFPGEMAVFDLIHGPYFPADVRQFLNTDYLADFETNANNAIRVATRKNEVLDDFTPTTPTLLCGSKSDGTVPYFNTTKAAEIFYERGVEVAVLDVEPYVTVSAEEDSGLAHHIKGNALCNALVRDQFFNQFK